MLGASESTLRACVVAHATRHVVALLCLEMRVATVYCCFQVTPMLSARVRATRSATSP